MFCDVAADLRHVMDVEGAEFVGVAPAFCGDWRSAFCGRPTQNARDLLLTTEVRFADDKEQEK